MKLKITASLAKVLSCAMCHDDSRVRNSSPKVPASTSPQMLGAISKGVKNSTIAISM